MVSSRSSERGTLSLSQFKSLVKKTFFFSDLSKYDNTVFPAIYNKICKNGKLTYYRYIDEWIVKYLCHYESWC